MSVCTGLTRGSQVVAVSDQLQHVLHAVHLALSQPHHHHLLLPVLQHPQLALPGQQVEHLATVDLEEAAGHHHVVVLVFRRLQILEHVPGCQSVDTILGVLSLAVELSAHGVSLAGASLTIGEAGGHASLEDALDQGLGGVLVD